MLPSPRTQNLRAGAFVFGIDSGADIWYNYTVDGTKFLDPYAINGLNLFAYCGNNPVMNFDPTGRELTAIFATLMLIGAVVFAIFGGIVSYAVSKSLGATGGSLFGWTLLGSVGGAFIGAGLGALAAFSLPAAGTALGFGAMSVGGGAAAYALSAAGVGAVAAVAAGVSVVVLFARTTKRDGYYGERWPGDHKPDHVHLHGPDTDVKIGKDGFPLDGEPPLSPQARKALKKLWDQITKLFLKW